jgi:putative selenium metabolism hydrolase
MDEKIQELAKKYRPLAVEILKEAIRVPADHIEDDPQCGLSNHEGPRLEYLRQKIVDIGAVANANDAGFDAYGNLRWKVYDPNDAVPPEEKTVVYFDGHTDTVQALRPRWLEAIGGGIDPYLGMTDPSKVDWDFLSEELGHLPPEDERHHLVFGRGAADQLGGVVCQIVASKIMLELASEGALRGVTVMSYGSVTEEDNDGGGPAYILREELPHAGSERTPDVVILTEGTGDSEKGAVGIYRGQRGRMQIEVEVTGKSCHGSMPWEGRNPLEYGAAIIAEAAERYSRGDGFAEDPFLGKGTRTASFATLDTPSDCAVPERFTFRFDRRLTPGEDPDGALRDVEQMDSVTRARRDGLEVTVRAPFYDQPTCKGFVLGNGQIYPGWVTPENHPVVGAAAEAYRRVATPLVTAEKTSGLLSSEPRVDRWIFSTDGVGFCLHEDESKLSVPDSKGWIRSGRFLHPPMFGIGPGIEQNTHKIGECVDSRELDLAIAVLARFPSLYRSRQSSK